MKLCNNNTSKENFSSQEKIFLALLPSWTPLIPPLGLSCLKSFLLKYGYNVEIADLNIVDEFKDIQMKYFDLLKKYIPNEKKGNIYNTGNDVFQGHMMAHQNHCNQKEYLELVKILVQKTFYTDIDYSRIGKLNEIINDFYNRLETYFLDLLEKKKPTILGLSVYSGTLAASLFAFKLTKSKYPHIKTIMGGGIFSDKMAVGSTNFEFFLEKAAYIDSIIVGEGELLFLKLLRGELPGSQKFFTIKDIDGETLDLNSTDIPYFSDFNLQLYPMLASYVSRGCPFQCAFCSETVQWGKYREKNVTQVVEELKKLLAKYDSQLFLMGDSLLNPIITDLAKELIKAGLSLYWDGYLRADTPVCDRQNTLLWRRGGFYRARLGLESGSNRVLESMGKKITPAQIKAAVSSLAFAGIKTTTYWVIGYPGETENDFQQTLDLIEELKSNIYEAECNPFNYYLKGQVQSQQWAKHKRILIYPGYARDLLIVQTWVLDCEPSRQETYKRVVRFVEHCNRLGIPNPYSINEIYNADKRWKKLHKNAVPALADFKNIDTCINENKDIKEMYPIQTTYRDNGDWNF